MVLIYYLHKPYAYRIGGAKKNCLYFKKEDACPKNPSSNGTSSVHKNRVEGELMGT